MNASGGPLQSLKYYPQRVLRSYAFEPPEMRKIAVKVINHYGDEVPTVHEE